MATLAGGPLETTGVQRSVPEGTPLPPGIYHGIIVKTAQKDTSDRTGVFVEVEFDISAPQEFANRKFWDRLNLINASAEAARIGKEGLADLAQAAGFPVLEDDEQLLGMEVMMELVITPAKPYVDKKTNQQREGKPQNNCRKYWAVGTDVEAAKASQKAAKGGAAAATTAAARPAAPAAAGAQRWAGTSKPAGQAAPAPVARPAAATPAPVQQATAPAPATNVAAPWKRNKQ